MFGGAVLNEFEEGSDECGRENGALGKEANRVERNSRFVGA